MARKLTGTVPEVAEMLSVSESTVRRLCYDGTFRFRQRCINGKLLILMEDVEKFVFNPDIKPEPGLHVKYGKAIAQ